VQSVQVTTAILKEVSLFFSSSPKRQLELQNQVVQFPDIEIVKKKKLVDLCRTRRVARIEAFEVFDSVMPAVVSSLEVISEETASGWNADSAMRAAGLYHSTKMFEILITSVVVKSALAHI
jgi:hypothetical protein